MTALQAWDDFFRRVLERGLPMFLDEVGKAEVDSPQAMVQLFEQLYRSVAVSVVERLRGEGLGIGDDGAQGAYAAAERGLREAVPAMLLDEGVVERRDLRSFIERMVKRFRPDGEQIGLV